MPDVYRLARRSQTASSIISLRILIAPSSLPPIFGFSASTLASGAGTTCDAGNSTREYDLVSEDCEGHQDSTISVFTRDANGTIRHF